MQWWWWINKSVPHCPTCPCPTRIVVFALFVGTDTKARLFSDKEPQLFGGHFPFFPRNLGALLFEFSFYLQPTNPKNRQTCASFCCSSGFHPLSGGGTKCRRGAFGCAENAVLRSFARLCFFALACYLPRRRNSLPPPFRSLQCHKFAFYELRSRSRDGPGKCVK